MASFFPILAGEKYTGFYSETEQFSGEVVQCVSYLREMLHYCCDGNFSEAKESAAKVIAQEAKVDEIRRGIEKKLYKGVIIQMGTEDKYALLEGIDDLADKAEIVARVTDIQQVKIPSSIIHDFRNMANKLEMSAKLLSEAVSAMRTDIEDAIKKATKLEIIREQVRELEFSMLKKIFSGKDTVKTILLKDMITLSGQVADKAEEAADRIITLALKYQS